MKATKLLKKTAAVLGISLVTALSMAPVASAGILIDSAGKNAIDAAEADIKEIGGATILVCAMAWGIKKTRSI